MTRRRSVPATAKGAVATHREGGIGWRDDDAGTTQKRAPRLIANNVAAVLHRQALPAFLSQIGTLKVQSTHHTHKGLPKGYRKLLGPHRKKALTMTNQETHAGGNTRSLLGDAAAMGRSSPTGKNPRLSAKYQANWVLRSLQSPCKRSIICKILRKAPVATKKSHASTGQRINTSRLVGGAKVAIEACGGRHHFSYSWDVPFLPKRTSFCDRFLCCIFTVVACGVRCGKGMRVRRREIGGSRMKACDSPTARRRERSTRLGPRLRVSMHASSRSAALAHL